jgi:glutamyl-tRNA(Gln) amidotransferase subunit D
MQTPRSRRKPTLDTRYSDKVAAIFMFPGIDPGIMQVYIERGYRGILLVGYGVGYVPTIDSSSFLPYIEEASQHDIPVVVGSQCAFGHYEVGKELQQAGAISAGDMLWEVALVKMMWVLGHAATRKEFQKLFAQNFVNEIIR